MIVWRITSAIKLKSSTRSLHTHNGSKSTCVRKRSAQERQVCCSIGQERYPPWDEWVFIAHTQKTNRWKTFEHLVVKPQFNLRSDHHSCNNYIQIWNPTVGGAGGLTDPGGGTMSYTEVGGQTTRGSLRPLSFSVEMNTLSIFLCFSSHSAHSQFFISKLAKSSTHSVFRIYLPRE
jgi:hypothetical protein